MPDAAKPVTGSCLCGSVAYEVTGKAIRFLYCHCHSCQKSTGSVHNASLAYPLGAVSWTKGEDQIQKFIDSGENPGYTRCFCRNCGSPVSKLSRNQQFWVVPSGSLDSDPGERPQGNIFWAERAPWYVFADRIPANEGHVTEPIR